MEKLKCSENLTNEQTLERIREKRAVLNNILVNPIGLVIF